MENEFIVFIIISVFLFIEISIRTIVVFVNKKFPWLIIENDEHPKLSNEGLKKFLEHGYDSELGWIRKPNTSHEEIGKFGKTLWTTNSIGVRTNPDFEKQLAKISCYGDSFTFCRQVNNDETWEHYLSKYTNSNVLNFGVGNYGIDQTLLRLKREFKNNKTEIVIVAVVPDTISRINSVWKHYYEYGNTFGFKPRFILKENSLKLIQNPMNEFSKFYEYKKYLKDIRKYDYFYKRKFKKEKIFFPYSITIFKNFKRNFGIIYWILKINFAKKKSYTIEWEPMQIIMKINLKWRVKLFQDKPSMLLFKKIIEEFDDFAKKNKIKLYFVLLPQKDDILFIKKNFHFYKKFSEDISKLNNLKIMDVTKEFLEIENLDEMYSDNNEYGGHYSKTGNEKIASIIYNQLKVSK